MSTFASVERRPARRKNKQPVSHPWMVDGENVKRARIRKVAVAIAAMRAKP